MTPSITRTIRTRVPRHIRRLIRFGAPPHNYVREEFINATDRNERWRALRSVGASNVVRFSDINDAGVGVYVVSWTPQATRGTPANSDAGGDHRRIAPAKILEKLGIETATANDAATDMENVKIPGLETVAT